MISLLAGNRDMSKQEWKVWSGRASWHQRRAGHVYADCSVFSSEADAERYVEGLAKHHPDRPVYLERPKG